MQSKIQYLSDAELDAVTGGRHNSGSPNQNGNSGASGNNNSNDNNTFVYVADNNVAIGVGNASGGSISNTSINF